MRPLSVMALVAVGSAAVVGMGSFIQPSEEVVEAKPSRFESIVRTELICPHTGGQPTATSEIAMLAVPDKDAATGDSSVAATPLSGTEVTPAPVLELSERGPIASTEVKSASPVGHVIQATGPLSAGLLAEQTTLAHGADLRGLADVSCSTPVREGWFVGGSGQVGHRGRLVLSNPDATAAQVDLTLWDDKGKVKAPAAEDIAVPARGERAVLLDALAPDSARLAVRAVVARGRVSMAMELRESKGLDPLGMTWVGGMPSPSEHVLLAGMPGTGDRILRILAPGDSDAIVKIDMHGPHGAFKPAGHEVVTVPAGTVAEVPLTDAASDQAIAVELSSDVPVAAAVRVAVRNDKGADLAYAAPVSPLAGPTGSLNARAGDGLASSLLLTNVSDEPTTASVRVLTADGAPAREQEVEVAAGATQLVALEAPKGQKRFAVVVYPKDNDVLSVSRVVTGSLADGAIVDVLGLDTAPATVRVPDVSWELSTGLSSEPSPTPEN